MLLAWRLSRTFASRFNFANVVFFLPAKVDLQVVQAIVVQLGATTTPLSTLSGRRTRDRPREGSRGHRASGEAGTAQRMRRLRASRSHDASSRLPGCAAWRMTSLPSWS